MEKKFELTNISIEKNGRKLYRIKALKSFQKVKVGELGGYVEKEENLSHKGSAWISDDALVYDNVIIRDNALVRGNAIVCDNALVYDNMIILGNAWITNIGDVLTVSHIGSRYDTTTFFNTFDSIEVKCGCFRGDINEFEKAVEATHKGSIYEQQYKLAIQLAKISIKKRN